MNIPHAPRIATLCSGIEAVSLAWKGLGYNETAVFFADNASFPSRFLKARHPETPNLGDLLLIDGTKYAGEVDVLWASFPCQAWSEAGKRRGFDDGRGALTLAGIRLVDEIDPPVFCFENVKGLLSDEYNAFGQFLGALAGEFGPLLPPGDRWTDAGYVLGPKRSIAWRTLDAKHFGLAQSRPRVFLVACPRGGVDPRDVLFEQRPEGDVEGERLERWTDAVPGDVGGSDAPAYRVATRGRVIQGFRGTQIEQGDTISNCLRATQGGGDKAFVLAKDGDRYDVRILMPEECEVLMGMPPGYTDIPYATRDQRLHAIGNSLAIPCVRFIGERIINELRTAA